MGFSSETYALLNNKINNVKNIAESKGTVINGVNNGGSAISVGSSFKNVNEIELEAGTYLINGVVGFSGNLDSSKVMQLSLYDVTNSTTLAIVKGTMGLGGGVSMSMIVNHSAKTKYRFRAAQNTGNDLSTAENLMFAVKL